VLIHKEGDRLIIEPEPRPNLLDTLRSLSPLGPEDAIPNDLDASLLPLRHIDL
jgi:antitoxin VapB